MTSLLSRPGQNFVCLSLIAFMLLSCVSPTLPKKNFPGPAVSQLEIKEAKESAQLISRVQKNQMSYEEREEMLRFVYGKVSQSGSEVCAAVTVRNFRYCRKFNLIISDRMSLNAYPFGTSNINIHKEILGYTDNEDEMALLIAHNMAHLLANHINEDHEKNQSKFQAVEDTANLWLYGAFRKQRSNPGNSTGSGFQESGVHSYSMLQEYEADYIASYLIASAGYSIEKAAAFYDKMYFLNPKTGVKTKTEAGFFDTHPFSVERIARLRRTAAEIADKRKARSPLVPNKGTNS